MPDENADDPRISTPPRRRAFFNVIAILAPIVEIPLAILIWNFVLRPTGRWGLETERRLALSICAFLVPSLLATVFAIIHRERWWPLTLLAFVGHLLIISALLFLTINGPL